MKSSVLLVHPLHGDETEQRIFQPGIEFPMSLVYLSAALEQAGIDSNILDLRLEENAKSALREKIDTLRPFTVGITASTAGIEKAALVASQVKAIDHRISTAIGGWHASALPEETLKKYPDFDYVIHGEGENALVNLVSCLDGGSNPEGCKGLAFRTNGTVKVNPREKLISNLDQIPFPARKKVPITRYHPKPGTRNYMTLPSTGILVGRGCPYNCLFCYKGVWGRGIRYRSPDNVLAEILECIEMFGIRDYRFYDDTVTFPRWDLKKFCETIISLGIKIHWNCWSRVNDVDEDKLRLMKEAGCYHIKFGIEFGTEKALKLSKKGATLEQARRAVELTKKAGIECKASFIFGIPGETIEDCNKTIDFALDTSPHFATFYAFDPIPGSPFYNQIVQGKIDPDHDIIPRATAQKLADDSYRKFYFRPKFLFQRLKAVLLHPKRELSMLLNGAYMLALYWIKGRSRTFSSLFAKRGREVSDLAIERKGGKNNWRTVIKEKFTRAFELTISVILFILAIPLMVVLAIIIKNDSPGPVIFKQTRIGCNRRTDMNNGNNRYRESRKNNIGGRPFTFYKFRTMYMDAKERFPEWYSYEYNKEEIQALCFKNINDPRLTRFGQRLRMTTLDELPNFLNVIKGDMSLVGPRPDIPEMVKYYEDWQKKKFNVKPGITGMAQINGRGLLFFQETLKHDVEYVEKKSLRLDIKIILKTIRATFLKIGAF